MEYLLGFFGILGLISIYIGLNMDSDMAHKPRTETNFKRFLSNFLIFVFPIIVLILLSFFNY